MNQCRRPLVSFRSPSEYDRPERRTASRQRAPPQGPAPFSVCRSGKRLPRVCLARVRCVSKVSNPLDALFLPRPLDRISDRSALGIAPFEGFPFRGMVHAFRPVLPAWCWLRRFRRALAEEPRPPPGLSSPRKSVAAPPPKRWVRPVPPLGFSPFRGASPFATAPLVTEPPPVDLDAVGGEPPALPGPSECRSRRSLTLSAESAAPRGVLRLISAIRVSAPDRSITTLDRKLVRAREGVKRIRPACRDQGDFARKVRASGRECRAVAWPCEGPDATAARFARCRRARRWRTRWITGGNG
jgi:hypothetical protein